MKRSTAKRLVEAAASRFAAKCWWADRFDLIQQGWCVLLKARRSFNPAVGVPEEGYVWQALMFGLKDYLYQLSTPATGGLKSSVTRNNTRGLSRQDMGALDTPAHAVTPRPEAAIDHAAWRRRVRARLTELTPPWVAPAVVPTLLDEVTAAAAAAAAGLDKRTVQAEVRLLRDRAAEDAVLYTLLQERAS